MYKFIIAVAFLVVCFSWWFVGGIHLEEVGRGAEQRISELQFENCVREGYQRALFGGFGGHVYYLCEREGNLFSFYLARRINSSELQFYSLEQETTIPTNLNISNQ